jgi:tetratricopeptide (TPR) repeat protein
MRIVLLALLVALDFAQLWGADKNAFFFSCDFMEKYRDSSWQVVDSRSYAATLSESFQFAFGNFSYRLQTNQVEDQKIRLQSQVNCMGAPPRNYLDDKLIMRGASVFFDSALVRGDSYFRIRLTFDSLGNRSADCEYRFSDSSFVFDPSARYDFYYVKNSLGDFRWNEIRDAFETEVKKVQTIYNFQDQNKINFYISPCALPDIGWDARWDGALDYSRNNLFAHFTHDANALFPQMVYLLKFMRDWGYAPALLQEGISSTLEMADMYAKDYLRNKKLPRMSKLGISRAYRKIDRTVSAYAAGSFVSHLIRTRGLDTFRQFYRAATDLTLPQTFQTVYGKPMDTVEGEWRAYLDTLTFGAGALQYYLGRSQSLLKTDDMTLYAEKWLKVSGDTAVAGPTLANLYYTFGDYAKAEKIFGYLARHDTTGITASVYFANMLLTDGKITEAENLYRKVATTDTSEYYATQKLGQIEHYRGNYPRAIEYLRQTIARNKVAANGVDLDIALGDAFAAMNQADSSSKYFQSALDNAKLLIGSYNNNPLHHLRAGRAALRLGSPKLALDYLDLAFFLEERMFYIGQILLARGEAHDLLREREAARAEYRKVLSNPTAFFDRQLAERFLKTPYHN